MDTRNNGWFIGKAVLLGILLLALPAGRLSAQSKPQRVRPATSSTPASGQDVTATRQQLFTLLRMSPKLTTVVARDPSLLAEHEYVGRNNPELAQFLQDHPEIVRSPEFYLFANPGEGNPELESQQRELLFERAVWPELSERDREVIQQEMRRDSRGYSSDMLAFLAFVFILGALLWLTRVLLQNRRWGKIFKVQTDTYGKLLEKFSTNEELLAYVRSDAGKRFLESASMPLNPESSPQMSGLAARVMGSLQLGIVLTLVGIGLLSLRNRLSDQIPILLFGTMGLTLGLGFIISSGLSFVLGRRLKLLPKGNSAPENTSWREGSETKDRS